MSRKFSVAVVGLAAVTAANSRATFIQANRGRRKAEDAIDRADEAYDLAQGLAQSGDVMRVQNDQVSDFLSGLAIPGATVRVEPGTFVSAPAVTPRMDLPESLAIAPHSYPPAVNAYTPDGKLQHPDEGLTGELVGTGLALTHPSVRAALMGIAHNGEQPSPTELAQIHRFYAALERQLRGLVTTAAPDGLDADAYAAAWQRMLLPGSTPGSTPRGVLFALLEDAGSVGVNATEGVYLIVTVPRNACAIGEAVRVRAQLHAASSHTTDTLTGRIRLNNNQVILTSGGVDIENNGDGVALDLMLSRRKNDASGNAVYAVSGITTGPGQVPFKTITVPANTDINLSITGQFNNADAANVSTCSFCVLEKL